MTITDPPTKKNPFIAGFLSFFWPPVGFLYLGYTALFWLFTAFFFIALLSLFVATNFFFYLSSLGIMVIINITSVIFSTYLSLKGKERRALSNTEKTVIPLILICIIAFNIFGAPYWVPGKKYSHYSIVAGSMLPTLKIGDYVFAKSVENDDLTYGDVIIFRYPEDHSIDFIKRIVALPGDVLEYRRKVLFINGDEMPLARADGKSEIVLPPLTEESLEDFAGKIHKIWRRMSPSADFGPIIIPNEHYFVMGDNRDNSNDSRVWGFLDQRLVKYRAEYTFNFENMELRPFE